jgi:hypothetical protein
LPATQVPAEYLHGEGRELTKTYDDSIRSIQAGVEYSDRVHKGAVRRSRVGLVALILLLASPMVFLITVSLKSRRVPADYEACLTQGVAAVIAGDYPSGKELLAKAVYERHENPEAHVLYGAASYHEVLQKPSLPAKKRAKLVYAVYREMHFALEAERDDPRANFFMALYCYGKGDVEKAAAFMQACLSHLSKIPDEKMRRRYAESGKAILEKMRSKEKLVLYSALDGARTDRKSGIEIPYGR